MERIIAAIKKRLNQFCEGTACAIEQGDWITVCRNVGIVLLAACISFAGFLFLLTLLGKMWVSFLGKTIMTLVGTPLVLYILWLSYKMNREDFFVKHQQKERDGEIDLAVWAENIYEYVQDAIFLVFRSVSEYTNIVTPSRASAIEFVDNPYSIEDGYVVFHFLAKVNGTVDTTQLKKDIQRTLQQLHRSHELNGIPRDLTEIDGAYYCPLQILGKPQDFGDHVQVSVVFATAQTVSLTRAHKLLNLDNVGSIRKTHPVKLMDDEL